MTGHEQVPGAGEFGVHLGDEARYHHGVHIGPSDQKTVNDIGRGEAESDGASPWNRDATRNKHELRSDDPHRDAAVRSDCSSQILFGKLT